MNKNIGTIAGKTVNSTEAMVDKVRTTTPKVKDSGIAITEVSKDRVKKGWKNIKQAYNTARQGDVIEVPAPKALTQGK